MLSDNIRARLEQLNRQPLGQGPSPGSATCPPAGRTPSARSSTDESSPRSGGYLESGREVENAAGRFLSIVHPLPRFAPEIAGQMQRVRNLCRGVDLRAVRVHPDIVSFGTSFPDDVLFLDLETCGLGGAMIFLVGLLHAGDEGIVVEQLLARNYAEERAILTSLWRIAAGKRLLVTFNGKSFDWPLVHDRSTLHRLGRREFRPVGQSAVAVPLCPRDPRPELLHLDVLHHARRRWRRFLPNCRLQTLERYLCRRVRCDDIPGHAIPQAYHQFVRGDNTRVMESILHHNALDLITMAQVAMRMLVESADPVPHRLPETAAFVPTQPGAKSA